MRSLFRIGPAVALLLLLSPATVAYAQRAGFDVESTYVVPLADAPSRGPANALVTIVEFSDFRCRYCQRAQATLRQLSQLFGNQLRFVFRHNPLDVEDASLAAEASYAARAQGQFWAMHDRLFGSHGTVTRDLVEGFAAELGLNMARFRRDLDDRTYLPAVKRDAAVAHALKATSTPMFFINGRPVRGSQHLSVFAKIVRQELANARRLVKQGVAAADVYKRTIARGRVSATPGLKDTFYNRTRLEALQLYRPRLASRARRRGGDDALVTLVEFSDFQCIFCAHAEPVLRKLAARYGKQLRIVYRHMPLHFHRYAMLAAEASMAAAAQGKFWPFHDAVFAIGGRAVNRLSIDRIARKLGLDMKRFDRALDSHHYAAAVRADIIAANLLGVDGTPAFFVNGTPISGAKPMSVFVQAIDAKLAEAKTLAAGGLSAKQVYDRVLKDAMVVEPRVPVAPER